MILLDTNILVYILNGNRSVLKKVSSLDEEFSISVITYLEISLGRNKNNLTQDEMEEFLEAFPALPITKEVSEVLLRVLEKKSASLRKNPLPDLFIGATAVAHNIPLLTNNKKDFSGFPELSLIEI
jgi:tRNA(fMet)-specific endonuclease VapC